MRESERNQIIDQVFYTAEEMLDSLNFLKDRIEDDDINTNNISIDSPAVNDNSANSNNDSSARQMNYTLDEDSAPPSVS